MIFETTTLWSFEEDILTRSWGDWMQAHTSFLKPLHRYEGQMNVLPDKLTFSGKDKRTGEDIFLTIQKYQIEQIYLGFDETYNAMETRDFGLKWLPLRVTFLQNGKEEKLYIITNYRLFGWSDNQDYFEYLKNWLS
jgi:hypothetical protein